MVRTVLAVSIGDSFKFGDKGINDVFPSISSLINVLLPNIYIIAGVLLFVLAIGGGFAIIKGSGSGDSGQVGSGQKALTAAIIGFVVIFASWWIIKIVEIITGMDIFKSGI